MKEKERKVVYLGLPDIHPYENNPRKNEEAVEYVANSIREFGFNQPITVDKDHIIVTGHTRYMAAQQLGLISVPVIILDDLTEEEAKAYRLADNKTGELAGWDFPLLDTELAGISELDMSIFGFEMNEEEPFKEREEAPFHESISVVIDCENDEEAERIFYELKEGGYNCRISTL